MNLEHANPALFAALAKAQGEVENASKNSSNPHFKSKYADLAEVLNTVRPVFSDNGLSLIQSTEFDGALVSVTTTIAHKDGGYVTAKASCVPAKTDAQGVGSATTYLRRYSLASVCGIAQEDDDGNASAHNGKPVAKITEKQEAELSDYIEATGTDRAKMLAYFKVQALSDLTAAQAVQATNMIKSKQKDAA
jgi:hypothetical protein